MSTTDDLLIDVVWNGLQGFLQFGRVMARPGVTFTPEQRAMIDEMIAMDNEAGAQRVILDALVVDDEAQP